MSQPPIPGVVVARQWDEKTLQRNVIELAHVLGWTVAHFRPAKTQHGWRTPAGADGAGWPDLVLVGRGQILFRELKATKGRLSVDQKAWADILERNGGDYGVWKPADWRERIIAELGGVAA